MPRRRRQFEKSRTEEETAVAGKMLNAYSMANRMKILHRGERGVRSRSGGERTA